MATLFLFFCMDINAQVWEDFSDGDFTRQPSWNGDTSKFTVNSNKQLQLYAEGADSAQLTFPYAIPNEDTIVWELWTKLSFTPTANNYTLITLFSDNADLLQAEKYIMVSVIDPSLGGKIISLYQNDQALLNANYHPTLSTNPLRIKVMLINSQQFELWIDTVGDIQQSDYVFNGDATAIDSIDADTGWFGVYCHFTSSRSRHFYFDDIGINRYSSIPQEDDTTTAYMPQPGDIFVNEILFNPPPGGADYVEIYSNSDSAIELKLLRFAKMDGDRPARLYPIADQGLLAPHNYLVVTTDANFVSQNYTVLWPNKIVEVPSLPAWNNASGCVALATTDSTILDRLDYTEEMHSTLLRDKEGVALERRSIDAPTQQASNWYSAASTAGFGTPTAKNSQSHEFLFIDGEFVIEEPLFSPDGDGYNDLLDISYSLQNCDLSCNIDIFDAAGRLVRHLLRGGLLGCQGSLTWDGTDDSGRRCPRGNYLVVAEAYNSGGTRQNWNRRITLVVR